MFEPEKPIAAEILSVLRMDQDVNLVKFGGD
jgi:hypothetical protein